MPVIAPLLVVDWTEVDAIIAQRRLYSHCHCFRHPGVAPVARRKRKVEQGGGARIVERRDSECAHRGRRVVAFDFYACRTDTHLGREVDTGYAAEVGLEMECLRIGRIRIYVFKPADCNILGSHFKKRLHIIAYVKVFAQMIGLNPNFRFACRRIFRTFGKGSDRYVGVYAESDCPALHVLAVLHNHWSAVDHVVASERNFRGIRLVVYRIRLNRCNPGLGLVHRQGCVSHMRHGHRHPFGHFHLGLQLGEFGGLDLADYLVICPAGELARLVSAVFMSQLYVVGIHRPGRYVGRIHRAVGIGCTGVVHHHGLYAESALVSAVVGVSFWQIEGALVNPSVGISGRHTVDPCYHILAAGGVVVAHP